MHFGMVFGTYNRRKLLERAVVSVRRASGIHKPVIIVVDGGSTDGSRSWIRSQPDTILVCQEGPLTGAVRAFNHGFGVAVDLGLPYIGHFNDDAEFVTDGAIERAIAIMESSSKVGEVAFEFNLRGPWAFEQVHNRVYANFGLVRREAGMQVAVKQGDPEGRRWWNPIYRTYGADCEFGMWLWHLGWSVEPGYGLRVDDLNEQDALRKANEGGNPERWDSRLFWNRWPTPDNFDRGPC